MIRVTYCRKDHSLTVEGHSLSAEKGKDLVCASASILVYTLAAFIKNLKGSGIAAETIVQIEEGNTELCCKIAPAFDCTVALVFDSICAGFDILAQDYPEYVKYEIINYTRDRKEKLD